MINTKLSNSAILSGYRSNGMHKMHVDKSKIIVLNSAN